MFTMPGARERSRVPPRNLVSPGGSLRATDFGVTGNGNTNDGPAVQAFLNYCRRRQVEAYFPGNRTYDMSNSGILIPDGLTITCGRDATFRRSAYPVGGFFPGGNATVTTAMFRGSNNIQWTGGVFNCNVVLATSTTSITIGTGSKAWTVAAGLDIHTNDFIRAYRTSAPSNYCEGLVTSYSGTTLTINVSFTNGSGTFTDWSFTQGAVYQCPFVITAGRDSHIAYVEANGLWYVGFLMDGGSGVAATSTVRSAFTECFANGIQNRGFYMYQDLNRCSFINCIAEGGAATPTDYGFNFNPANPSVANNAAANCSVLGCMTNQTLFQGFGFGDQITEMNVVNCVAQNVTNTTGNGFSVFFANVTSPGPVNLANCHAKFCGNAGFLAAGANYTSMVNCSARSNTVAGFKVDSSTNNSTECMLNGCTAQNNAGIGIHITAGATNTIVADCRTNLNGTNYTNAGTATVANPNPPTAA